MLKIDIKRKFSDFFLSVAFQMKDEFTALLGKSGAGKTSTLSMIAGLSKPDSGEISLNGEILFSSERKICLKPQERDIGYVFQEARLFPNMNCAENLKFASSRVRSNQQPFRFDDIVGLLQIEHLLRRMPRNLSGGEKQRVALGRAILSAPKLLLLDEPLGALDINARLVFLQFLQETIKHLHLPALYVTHDIANILRCADDIVYLEDGAVRGQGEPTRLLQHIQPSLAPVHDEVPNVFEVSASRRSSVCATGKIEFVIPQVDFQKNESFFLNIPASEIILSLTKPTEISASNILKGEIVNIAQIGVRFFAQVDAGEEFMVEILKATVQRLSLHKEQEVYLIIKATSFRRL